jgi:uncharacterized phiE125 gp8 family phage protein
MWYQPTETVEPGSEPVSLQEAKMQARATDFVDDDAYLRLLISAARSHVEGYCSAKFASRTIEAECTSFADFCYLPVAPVNSVTSISYVDTAGATQTLADTVYELRGDSIVLKYGQNWPATQPQSLIAIVVQAGFATCPSSVKHAMLLWISEAYLNRESAELASWTTLDALLCNHRYYP